MINQRNYYKSTVMRPQNIIALLFMLAFVASCGSAPEGVEGKKAELAKAKEEIKALEATISTLEEEIKAEDPTFGQKTENSTLVTAITANKESFAHKIEVRGNVESRTNMTVSAEMMGQLEALSIKEGQSVRKGQVLATIDSETIENNIEEVEKQLEFATTIYEKRDRLWKKNIGTEVEYLQAKNNKEGLEKTLATLNTQLAKAEVKAPFSGTIETVPVKQGEIIQPGQPLAYLVSSSDMYINAEVSESYIGRFNEGDAVEVNIPSLGQKFSSEIASVGRVINAASRTFTIEVKLPKVDDYLKTNLVASVMLTDYKSNEAVVIPSRIIQEDLEGNFVYQVKNKRASKVHVKLGYSYNNHTEVVNGLAGGEMLIDKGNRTVADGTSLSIQN